MGAKPRIKPRLGAATRQALLAFLRFSEPVPKSVVKAAIDGASDSGVEQVINRMKHAGLVRRTDGGSRGFMGLWELTPKGRKIARSL